MCSQITEMPGGIWSAQEEMPRRKCLPSIRKEPGLEGLEARTGEGVGLRGRGVQAGHVPWATLGHTGSLGIGKSSFCGPGPKFSFCARIWPAHTGVSSLTQELGSPGPCVGMLQNHQGGPGDLACCLLMALWLPGMPHCLSPEQELQLLLSP